MADVSDTTTHNISLPAPSSLAVFNFNNSEGANGENEKPSLQTNIQDLQTHLQLAMKIELSTIPLYLFAMYSIKDQGDPVVQTIRGVVIEEMIHLALAGNALCAYGGKPQIFPSDPANPKPENFPVYPMNMTDMLPVTPMSLRAFDGAQAQSFANVERRAVPFPTPPAIIEQEDAAHQYGSLGVFYRAVQDLINEIPDGQITYNTKYQIQDDQTFNMGDGFIVVDSQKAAFTAMETIIDQGEGADLTQPGGHLKAFESIEGATPAVYPAHPDPVTSDYTNPGTQAVSTMLDASFSYLLLCIQYLWQVDTPDNKSILVNNMMTIMGGILPTVSGWLFQQPYQDGSAESAGPCFGYYPFNADNNYAGALKELQALAAAAGKVVTDPTISGAIDSVNGLTEFVPQAQ